MTPMVPPNPKPDPERTRFYEEDARRYLKSLTLEHFMEATAQATQRKITLESFDLVHAARPDVQLFNELLIQYNRPGRKAPGKVVPDNMVVVHPDPLSPLTAFVTADQPVGPLLVLEYVSKQSERKDYDDNYDKYEQELKVPYYLLFYPDNQELTLFRLGGGKYASVIPNAAGRLAIPELELEAALLGGWVRFWFRGKLLLLPADLQQQLDEAEQRAAREAAARLAAERQTEAERQARLAAEQRAVSAEAENARLRELLARLEGPPA